MTLCKSVEVTRTTLMKVNGYYQIRMDDNPDERVTKSTFDKLGATYRDAYVIQEAVSFVIDMLRRAKRRDITSDEFLNEFKGMYYTLQADTYKMRSISNSRPYDQRFCVNYDDLVVRPDMGGRMSINILVPLLNRINIECNKRTSIGGGALDLKYVNTSMLETIIRRYLMLYAFHMSGTADRPLYHILPAWAFSVGGRIYPFSEEMRSKHHMGEECYGLILLPMYINFIVNNLANDCIWNGNLIDQVPEIDRNILPPTPRQPIVFMDVNGKYPVMEKLDPYEPAYMKGCVRYGIPIGKDVCYPKRI